ncbi:hypothetical protein D3C81_1165440 [compost metagenome]
MAGERWDAAGWHQRVLHAVGFQRAALRGAFLVVCADAIDRGDFLDLPDQHQLSRLGIRADVDGRSELLSDPRHSALPRHRAGEPPLGIALRWLARVARGMAAAMAESRLQGRHADCRRGTRFHRLRDLVSDAPRRA